LTARQRAFHSSRLTAYTLVMRSVVSAAALVLALSICTLAAAPRFHFALVIDAKDKSITVEPVKPLAAGDYVAKWRGAGDDGHVMTGEVKFTIAAK